MLTILSLPVHVHGIFPFIFLKNCFHQFISCPCIDVVDVLRFIPKVFFLLFAFVWYWVLSFEFKLFITGI